MTSAIELPVIRSNGLDSKQNPQIDENKEAHEMLVKQKEVHEMRLKRLEQKTVRFLYLNKTQQTDK